jgi:hypothetical protein
MCRSQAEGGQRCAAHTRPAFIKTSFGTPEWEDAAAAFASTPAGYDEIVNAICDAEADDDFGRAAALTAAMRKGQAIRASNMEVAERIHDAKGWQPGETHPIGGYDQIQQDDHGSTFYTHDGELHRLDGPAFEDSDGNPEFWRHGEAFCELACIQGTPPAYCTRTTAA